MFSRFLEKGGYVVETAETGKEAIEKTKAKRYDVALIDVRLPYMDGTDLLPKLKSTDFEMVMIVITGFSTKVTCNRAADCGAGDYFVKPVKPDELLEVIKERLLLRSTR